MFFFFNDTATTEIYTLSLHDALPISDRQERDSPGRPDRRKPQLLLRGGVRLRPEEAHSLYGDRKSTRLNSSHANISYAVFCLKKKTLNTELQEQHVAPHTLSRTTVAR